MRLFVLIESFILCYFAIFCCYYHFVRVFILLAIEFTFYFAHFFVFVFVFCFYTDRISFVCNCFLFLILLCCYERITGKLIFVCITTTHVIVYSPTHTTVTRNIILITPIFAAKRQRQLLGSQQIL